MRTPAEWERHRACWLAWPAHAHAGEAQLAGAKREIGALAELIGTRGAERVELLVANAEAEREAREALGALGDRLRCHRLPYGDVWLRDTGPVFAIEDGGPIALRLRFNGWGGRYLYPDDEGVGARIADRAGVPVRTIDLVGEGGAIDVDGEGTCLTTRSCLLNDNRNAGRDEAAVTRALTGALAFERVVWLDAGLGHDHTDGHVDNVARFVAPAVVAHARAADDDPNHDVLDDIERALSSAHDARGRTLDRVVVPSPGRVLGADGVPRPASYLNFYIANGAVAVPAFGSPHDEEARRILATCFPDREAVSLPARALLEEGGTFHCVTCQEPDASVHATLAK